MKKFKKKIMKNKLYSFVEHFTRKNDKITPFIIYSNDII